MKKERKTEKILGVEIIERLYERLIERKDADPSESYTAKLFSEGVIKIAQKVGEEGVETALAAVAESNEELIEETQSGIVLVKIDLSCKIDNNFSS